jgi:hypothetical protein
VEEQRRTRDSVVPAPTKHLAAPAPERLNPEMESAAEFAQAARLRFRARKLFPDRKRFAQRALARALATGPEVVATGEAVPAAFARIIERARTQLRR